MKGRMLSPRESIRQHLLNKISPGDGIRGTPSRLGEDIWIQASKLDSQAGPDGSVQLPPLVVLGLLARGLGPKPVAPTKISNYFSLYLFIICFFNFTILFLQGSGFSIFFPFGQLQGAYHFSLFFCFFIFRWLGIFGKVLLIQIFIYVYSIVRFFFKYFHNKKIIILYFY